MRDYAGGLREWSDAGLPLAGAAAAGEQGAATPAASRASGGVRGVLDALAEQSFGSLLRLWLWMALACGAVYWLLGAWSGRGLVAAGQSLDLSWRSLLTAVYFSFVTALSIGYGDVTPVGELRALAVAEGAAGLLLFGVIISKLVSRRQEELTEEIHRIAFEDRLGRVRTNLHLALSELQALAEICAATDAPPPAVVRRVESAVAVFAGELRAIHDLLYRPQRVPDEEALETILATLAAALGALVDLLACGANKGGHTSTLGAQVRSVRTLAEEICGDCVPREYTARLRIWMDRVRALAGELD